MLGIQDFFQYEFLIWALLGVILLSIITGILSPLVVTKRYAFLGEALGHSTLVSASLAYMILGEGNEQAVFMLTLLITLFLTGILAYSTYKQRIPSDSMIGVFLSSTLALGIILHSLYLRGKIELEGLLFGSVLTLGASDVIILGILLIIIMIVFILRRRHWLLYTIEEETAHLYGVNTKLLHFAFYGLLTLTIVAAIKIAGTILVTALLVIPGSFAVRVSVGAKQTFISSMIFACSTCVLGLICANHLELPPGATMALMQFLAFAILVLANKIRSWH